MSNVRTKHGLWTCLAILDLGRFHHSTGDHNGPNPVLIFRCGRQVPAHSEEDRAALGAARRVPAEFAQDAPRRPLQAARELRVRRRRAGQRHVQGRAVSISRTDIKKTKKTLSPVFFTAATKHYWVFIWADHES